MRLVLALARAEGGGDRGGVIGLLRPRLGVAPSSVARRSARLAAPRPARCRAAASGASSDHSAQAPPLREAGRRRRVLALARQAPRAPTGPAPAAALHRRGDGARRRGRPSRRQLREQRAAAAMQHAPPPRRDRCRERRARARARARAASAGRTAPAAQRRRARAGRARERAARRAGARWRAHGTRSALAPGRAAPPRHATERDLAVGRKPRRPPHAGHERRRQRQRDGTHHGNAIAHRAGVPLRQRRPQFVVGTCPDPQSHPCRVRQGCGSVCGMAAFFDLALPLVRALPPETAHRLTVRALAAGLRCADRRQPTRRTSPVPLWHRRFPNPVGPRRRLRQAGRGAGRDAAASASASSKSAP